MRLLPSCLAAAQMRHPEKRLASCALERDRDSHCHWFSLECLILSEICDCQTERVCLDQVVWNGIAEEKDKVGGVKRPLDLDMLSGRIATPEVSKTYPRWFRSNADPGSTNECLRLSGCYLKYMAKEMS